MPLEFNLFIFWACKWDIVPLKQMFLKLIKIRLSLNFKFLRVQNNNLIKAFGLLSFGRFMKECYFPIQEAARTCNNDPVIMSEVEVLQEDVHQHTRLAEAGKARATGRLINSKVKGQRPNNFFNFHWAFFVLD